MTGKPFRPRTTPIEALLPKTVYMHVLDGTERIPGNTPSIKYTTNKKNPFGKPGEDYSAEYPWTYYKLTRQQESAAAPATGALPLNATNEMCDAGAEHLSRMLKAGRGFAGDLWWTMVQAHLASTQASAPATGALTDAEIVGLLCTEMSVWADDAIVTNRQELVRAVRAVLAFTQTDP